MKAPIDQSGRWQRPVLMPASLILACYLGLLIPIRPARAADQQQRPAVGERAPDFELPTVGPQGYIQLSEQYKQGPVVVVILRGYPGYQCPFCNTQFSSLQNRAAALATLAQRVIVVYPGQGDSLKRHAESFVGSRNLADPLVVVRDPEMKMVTEWGLRWNASRETAYPATYVIDRSGRIRWFKVSDNHGDRATATDIIRELRKL